MPRERIRAATGFARQQSEKVKLISLYAGKNQLYYAENEFVITNKKTVRVDLQKISKEEFQKKMLKL